MAYQFDFSSLDKPNLLAMGDGMLVTLQITCTAIVAGVVLGTLLALMRNSTIKPISWLATGYIALFRSLPLVIVLLWFFLVIPQVLQKILFLPASIDLRMPCALVAFSLFEAAYFAEIVRSGIRSISRTQTYAASALGLSPKHVWLHVILPQVFLNMRPLLLTQCIVLFQDTSLVYVSALTDFFGSAATIGERDGRSVEMLLFAGLVYFVICFICSLAVRRGIRPRHL